ncbi:dynein heavy chain 14, axonemal-like, partial [Leptonychotes weddellii]|uniref:Dynein heavy chain 14, axonemal-like n=1 Tax=Leptonychotes weddellii TaxID=9713 RepID=A0A2U3YFF1_LEPWE
MLRIHQSDYFQKIGTQQNPSKPDSHKKKEKSKGKKDQTHACPKVKKKRLVSYDTTEPEDDDVTRHIIRLRDKFGWQTMLPQHCLEYKSSKIAIQKIILKEPLTDDGEFVYCLPRKNHQVLYNPYDLQVVSAHRARHCKEFWIITASFISKVTKIGDVEEIELIPTLEWLLERTCYYLLQQFKIFSNFRCTTAIWASIPSIPSHNCTPACQLDRSRTYSLDEFCKEQLQQATQALKQLEDIRDKAISEIKNTVLQVAEKKEIKEYFESNVSEDDTVHFKLPKYRCLLKTVLRFLLLVDYIFQELIRQLMNTAITLLLELFNNSARMPFSMEKRNEDLINELTIDVWVYFWTLNFIQLISKIIPLCRDPRLSLFTESFLITSLPNKTESGMAYKKPARWPDCQILFEMDPIYQNKIASLLTVVGNSMGQVNVYSCKFIKYCSMVQKAKAMSMKISSIDELTSVQFKTILAKFRNYLQYIINMAIEKRIGIFKVVSLNYQSECLPYVENVIHLIHNLLRSVIERKNTNLLEIVESSLRKLDSDPTEIEEFVEHFTFLDAISSKIFALEKEYSTVAQLHSVVRYYQIQISEEQIAIHKILLGRFGQLKTSVKLSKTNKDAAISRFRDNLEAHITGLRVDLRNLKAKDLVDEWDQNLTLFSHTLEEWMNCQRNWLYLEPIFHSVEIQRQLPAEAKLFSHVISMWREIMLKIQNKLDTLRITTSAGVLEILQNCNTCLDYIMKGLEDYLEIKRMIFPRFYFLSNAELLDILADSGTPESVQPHLVKCFENIKQLLIWKQEIGPPAVIMLISAEGETLLLPKKIRVRSAVEQWLVNVEKSMFDVLKNERLFFNDRLSILIFQSQIMFYNDCIKSFVSSHSRAELEKVHAGVIHHLEEIAELVALDTNNSRTQVVLGALLTLRVHCRDIVRDLLLKGISSAGDFEWTRHLQYKWNDKQKLCYVSQGDASFTYGYEYLGCTPRLVVTPLTNRCWLTLTGALLLNLGGCPVGPASTGKTESVKDLAKSLGKHCVVFNCFEDLDYKIMGKFFFGLVQSGAWCCLDEFNWIDVQVLSVIASQILTIKAAKDSYSVRFVLEGKEIRINMSCAVFVTMNPGYKGRVELPDNLKSLFRPVAMMAPHYQMITEIMLFSLGFKSAKSLSGKLVSVYELASKQLSQQDHYDFGLRSLKTVLIMAGKKKQMFKCNTNDHLSETDETPIIIEALREASLPKFLPEDVPRFEKIIGDIFPGVAVSTANQIALEKAIFIATQQLGLQHWPAQKKKIIQFYNQLQACVGVMLVGPTCGGKTTVRRVLERALTLSPVEDFLSSKERESISQIPGRKGKVDICVLNPKCITVGELYGQLDPNTMEWTDGLLSTAVRNYVYFNTARNSKKDSNFGLKSRISDASNNGRTEALAENTWYLEKNPDKLKIMLQKLFVFAFTWAFGGTLKREDEHEDDTVLYSSHEPDTPARVTYDFDNLVHELFESNPHIGKFWGKQRGRWKKKNCINLPSGKRSIFGYFVDLQQCEFIPWSELLPSIQTLIQKGTSVLVDPEGSSENLLKIPEFGESISHIATRDTVSLSFLISLLLKNFCPVLLTGDPAVGKTSAINEMLQKLEGPGALDVKYGSILGEVLLYNEIKKSRFLKQNISILLSETHKTAAGSRDKPIKKPAVRIDESSLKSDKKGIIVSTVNFSVSTTAAKAKEMVLKKLVRRTKDILGAPKNSR